MELFFNQNFLIFESLVIPYNQLEGTSNLDKEDLSIFIFIIYIKY